MRPTPKQVQPRSTVEQKVGKGEVANCYSLHVRNGGWVNYKVIGYLQRGDKVDITGVWKETGWYEIKWKGGKGYCSHKYINAKLEEPKPPPVDPPKDTIGEDKNFIKNELYSLKGNASIFPQFNLMPRDIIELKGIGNVLSGKYYVESTNISIGSDGIDMTVNVSKNAFSKPK